MPARIMQLQNSDQTLSGVPYNCIKLPGFERRTSFNESISTCPYGDHKVF